jgi:hypothetical protein
MIESQPRDEAKEIALTGVERRDIDWSIDRMDGRTKLLSGCEDFPASKASLAV